MYAVGYSLDILGCRIISASFLTYSHGSWAGQPPDQTEKDVF